MAKLYGKGTIVELIAGKKYKITFSYGKDPDTGAYRRHVERFLGTKRQAELRVEELRVRYERIDELRKLGLDFEELESYGLDVDIINKHGHVRSRGRSKPCSTQGGKSALDNIRR